MVNYEDLPEEVIDLIGDAYYDGLVNDDLHTFLINNETLVVVPLEFPELSGKEIVSRLDRLEELDQFRDYLSNEDLPVYVVSDITEEMVEEFDKAVYSVIKESYAEDYLEKNFETQLQNYINGYGGY